MAHDILIIDDEKDIRSLIADILGDEGYNCQQASNSDEALDKIKQRFDVEVIWRCRNVIFCKANVFC